MATTYRSANGRIIDFDGIRLKNEDVIAVGNMKTNGRGDLLGPGGKVIKTKDQVMKEYYALNTPIAMDELRDQYPAQPPAVADSRISSPLPSLLPTTPTLPAVTEGVNLAGSGIDDEQEDLPTEVTVAPTRKPVNAITRPIPNPTPRAAVTGKKVQPPVPDDTILAALPIPPENGKPAIRGSLASAVAKTSVTVQTEKLPAKKANGIQRF